MESFNGVIESKIKTKGKNEKLPWINVEIKLWIDRRKENKEMVRG